MTAISITVPDAIAQRVANGFAYYNGYQDQIVDATGKVVPNPVTKMQFIKNCIKTYTKSCVVGYEAAQAAETARQTAIDSATTEITIGD